MAIGIEPEGYVIGLQEWETTVFRTQKEGVRSGPGDLDLVTHSLRKFARLAAKGNPTILLPLFTPDDAIIKNTSFGNFLIKHRDLFITKSAGRAFQGYLKAQKDRLLGIKGQMRTNRRELVDKYGFDTKYAGHVIRLGYQGVELMTTGLLSLPMKEMHRDTVVKIRMGGLSFEAVMELANRLERELKHALDHSTLPEEANIGSINQLLSVMYKSMWSKT